MEDFDVWRARMLLSLKEASFVIRSHPDVVDHFLVSQARVPIVKFVHAPSGISCDVSCNNTLGVSNSTLLRAFQEVDPRVRPLMMTVKFWAKTQRFVGSPESNLNSYALCLLVVFYLQRASILPSVETLQRDEDVKLSSGWNVAFRTPDRVCDLTGDSGGVFELLKGFFRFYKDFDSTAQVVCPLLGRPVPINDFDYLSALPASMARYVSYVRENKVPPFRYSSICVQDPFELSHNVSFGFRNWEVFRIQCAKAELVSPGNLMDMFIPPEPKARAVTYKKNVTESFKLRFSPNVRDEPTEHLLHPVAKFLGQLFTFSYCGQAAEFKKEGKPDKPIVHDDLLLQWGRPYDLTFPFNMFHRHRTGISEEVYTKPTSDAAAQSVLERERAITALMKERHNTELSRCASPSFRLTLNPFPAEGKIAIKLQLIGDTLPHIFFDFVRDFRWTVTDSVASYLKESYPSFVVDHVH